MSKVSPNVGVAPVVRTPANPVVSENARPQVPVVDISEVTGVEANAPRVETSVPRVETSSAAPTVSTSDTASTKAATAQPTAQAVTRTMEMLAPFASSREERKPSRLAEIIRNRVESGIAKPPVADDGSAEMANARTAARARTEDAPLPNESTRTTRYDDVSLELARELDQEMTAASSTVPEADAGTPAKPNETPTPEEAKRTASGMTAAISKSTTRPTTRSKPSIMDRKAGVQPRRGPELSTDNAPVHRPREVIRTIKDMYSRMFGNHGVGYRIYGKMIGLPILDFREVGVGVQEIAAVMDQNPDMLDNLIKASVSKDRLAEYGFTSSGVMLVGEIIPIINDNYVEVFTAKPPDNRGQDVQRRKLRILESEQRGIYLHPVMAAMYTADFDGDDMEISLDPSVVKSAKDPMEHMIGIDGAQSLDTNFLPVSNLISDYEDGKTTRDYVEEVMLYRLTNISLSDSQLGMLDNIINAVLALSDTWIQGSDQQAAAWGDLFRAARVLADSMAMAVELNAGMSPDRVAQVRSRISNREMSNIINDVYQGFRNIKVEHTLREVGEVVPRDTLPKAFTQSDVNLYNIIDGMVLGRIPNNFQELKVMMGGFLGNVKGKSAPFRFTADVGKMMKMDSRFRIGDQYVIDPDNDQDMMDFLQCTVKYAYSKRMAVDIKTAGRSYQLGEELRARVIKKVGFPEKYDSMAQFINAFVREYNRNAAIVNEANLVWLTNMSLLRDSTQRKAVHTISSRNGITRYSDIATSFIDVYGTYSFDRIFGDKISYKDVRYDKKTKQYVWSYSDLRGPRSGMSNSNATEADWRRAERPDDTGGRVSTRWIRAKYENMSIKAFSVNNDIIPDKSEGNLIDTPFRFDDSDERAVDCLIAAIADKRTSTASSFNTSVTGKYSSKEGHGRSHVSRYNDKGDQTVVGAMDEFATDIRNADLEGTLLAPGFYAGIGSREAPENVQKAMTELAKDLASMGDGWVLRSGHAEGSDQAFEAGAGSKAQIYLPCKNFQRGVTISNGAAKILFEDSFVSEEERRFAEESVIRYHPSGRRFRENWERGRNMKPQNDYEQGKRSKLMFPYEAMRRNYFQVMGIYGQPEVAFVACYDDHGGGTAQAIRIAQDRGIPVFNAADYDGDLERWKNDVKEAATKAQLNQLYRVGTTDQMLHVDDAVMAMNATGYELFRDLGMDSTAGFLNSLYGRKIIEYAGNLDVIAGIRAAMVFRQQTKQITHLADELRLNDESETPSVARYMQLKNQADFAMDELAAKSTVWRGILMEMRAPKTEKSSAFVALRAGKTGRTHWEAGDYWSAESVSHDNIRDVIEDLDMPWPLKCDIITDVVRWQTQVTSLKSFEISYQLEIGGDSRFALNGGAPKASLQVFKDTVSASHRYANLSLRNIRREVKAAADTWRDTEGALTNTIHNLATNPQNLVHIDDRMYADAILAVRDKVYAQTEKAKKHPSTNAIYSAISLQRNGGYFNDVYRYDDRLLGLQHKSQLTAADIVRMLDDPNYVICVYDDYGSIAPLSQHYIMGIDHDASESEIWDWLVSNPRIACALRAGTACVMADSDAKGYLGSRMSLTETIGRYGHGDYDTLGNVKYLMRDHPVYAGIVSLLTPAHQTSTRSERNRVPDIENRVCNELYAAAESGHVMAASRVLANLGITRLKLRSLLTSDYDKFMASMGFKWNMESIGEARAEADDIYDTIEAHVGRYISEIRENVESGHKVDLSKSNAQIDIDIESVASFWDAVQELSGAKVGVSTGIEGSETYRLSYWVTHMNAKDHYASLQAIADLIENHDNPMEFDGMWTNKGPLSVRVTEDGVETNIEELLAKATNSSDEVVVTVPDGFMVPDRSTDTFGNQVPSLYISMVSKRANGAEKFNLKAMKAGLDGTDSVTKMRNKYITETYQGREYPIIFMDVRNKLVEIANSQGINEARMELAKIMMERDQEMSYRDMTLANYMSIAEMMLMQAEDGTIMLRSLEQLVEGVKNRLGARVDEMNDKEVTDAVVSIINDTSDQGIGQSMAWDPYEMLSELRPKSNAGNAISAIKTSSSVFKRNYDLLREIEEETGITPLSDSERYALHNRFTQGKPFWNECNVVREYQVIGYYSGRNRYEFEENIGPSSIFMIENGGDEMDKNRVKEICDMCWENGNTVLVHEDVLDLIPERYLKDAVPASDKAGHMLIPMFDARLNGSEGQPFVPQFGIFKIPFERYVISVEDPLNVFELGDAQYKFTRALLNRVKAYDSGGVQFTAMQLFPNVFANKAYKDCRFKVGLASRETIEKFIISDPANPKCTIDYTLVEGAQGFEQRVHDVNKAIRNYAQMFDLADKDGVLRNVDEMKAGDIIGWADLLIEAPDGSERHVLSPLIPFQLHEKNRVPESFTVNSAGPTNNDGSLFSIDWGFERELVDGFIKYFDSSGGANKGMISLANPIEDIMRLKNGMDVDAYCAAESTDSRKIGSDRRIKTMISLMAIARMEGYNFARSEGAFPNDPDIREALSKHRLERKFWAEVYESGRSITFSTDPEMNGFLNYECKKIYDNGGNPSDYLATDFWMNDDESTDYNEHVMWEFECMFENSLSYEDALLKFIHHMKPEFCPNGLDDDTEYDRGFRLYREGNELGTGFNRGMLQMKVPYPMSDGRTSYTWSNVFVGMSFFGEEWSGNGRPNVSGASDMLDAENTEQYYKMPLSEKKGKIRDAWATSGIGRPSEDAGALGLE